MSSLISGGVLLSIAMVGKNLEFNPFSIEFQSNPYPTYHLLRSEDPVHRVKGFRFDQWFLTRYNDVHRVLNDVNFQVDDLPERLSEKSRHLKQGDFSTLSQTISKWLFFLEPPDHTRLRSLVSKTFSTNKVEQLRPRIEAIAHSLIQAVESAGQMDVMADLAAPLPTLVSAEILGVPLGDRATLTQWACDLFHVFDQPLSLKDYEQINQVAIQFRSFFQSVIADRKRQPQDDLITQLIKVSESEIKLSEEELLGFLCMLFSVGQETTENLIGNGTYALLHHPEAWVELQENPALVASAVEELLRYDSPVQMISRTAIAPAKFDDKIIQPGDKVHLLLGAANRDPARFTEPDTLNLHRKEGPRLPFGSGIHYCLGSELARVQGQVALATLLQHLHNPQLESGIQRRKNIVLRGFKMLPIRFERTRAEG